MSEASKEVDIDHLFKVWVYNITEGGSNMSNLYKKNDRKGYIEDLFIALKKYGVEYDDALRLKKRVVNTLVSDEGLKHAGKNGHIHGTWAPNTEMDFDNALAEHYNPNAGLEVENVVFKDSVFKIPKSDKIINWVKEKYGDSEQIIEEAHNINSTVCLDYFSELERTLKNGHA